MYQTTTSDTNNKIIQPHFCFHHTITMISLLSAQTKDKTEGTFQDKCVTITGVICNRSICHLIIHERHTQNKVKFIVTPCSSACKVSDSKESCTCTVVRSSY